MVFLRRLKAVLFGLLVSSAMFIPISYASTEHKVKSTDTLSGITSKFYKHSKLSRHQMYIGILAENPHAFRFGNINYLKNKQLLNIPEPANLQVMEKEDAEKLVARHNAESKKAKKIQLDPPFKDHLPKNSSKEDSEIARLVEKKQSTSQELEKLQSETDKLRMRLKKLTEDKIAVDAELRQLDEQITQ